MSSSIELLCLEGPLSGESIPLSKREGLLIGRSRRGLHLVDPMVSPEHAEISFAVDQWYLRDLDSQSGTFVDEYRVVGDPVVIRAGMKIRIGESIFQVSEVRERPPWLIPAIGLFTFCGVVAFGLAIVVAQPVVYEPRLMASTDIHFGEGNVAREIPIPIAFIREHGLDHRDFSLARATDFDGNGTDELWLETPSEMYVVTFSGADWNVLGQLPSGCRDRQAASLPDQVCDSEEWFFDGTRYRVAPSDGVVAWLWVPTPKPVAVADAPEEPPPPPATAPFPYRITLSERERMAGFLAARGVEDRIHYLICEDRRLGTKAQVLTESGELKALNYGCMSDLQIYAPEPFQDLSRSDVAAVAFTASGRRALVEDFTTFKSGSSDGLFLKPSDRAVVRDLAARPNPRMVVRLGFIGEERMFQPVARPTDPAGRRDLIPGESAEPPPAPATTTWLLGEGTTLLDPSGCSELQVTTPIWHCALNRLCFPKNNFVEVRQVGCGRNAVLLQASYGGAEVVSNSDADIEVRAMVDARAEGRQVDVLRVRISYRLNAPESSLPTERE